MSDTDTVVSGGPIGILAYGSLTSDPGDEIGPLIASRKAMMTPFGIEYGRYSTRTRGGAPTVVPHPKGAQVAATVLVLRDDVTLQDAKDMLWRRETGNVKPKRPTERTSVRIAEHANLCGLSMVISTEFARDCIEDPEPAVLAQAAIASVRHAPLGKDGITYLMSLMDHEIITPLTHAYRDEILRQTGTASLRAALVAARQT